MSNAAQFNIVITALDHATATLQRVNRSVAGMVSPFRNVGTAIAALGEAAGITKLAAAADNAITKVGVLGSRIGGLLGPLAALGGIATAGGLVELAKGATEWGHELTLASQKTGLAVDQLAKLHFAASTVGIDAEQVDRAMFRLNLTIADAAIGKNKAAVAMFRGLGISIRDSNHHIRDATSIFADLSEAMRRNHNFRIQAQIVSTAFTKRFGQALIPLMLKGGAATRELYKTFEQLYGRVTPQVVASLDKGYEAFERLKFSVSGLKLSIGSALLPVLEPVIVSMTKWVAANRKWISTNIQHSIGQIVNYLRGIDWKKIGDTVMGFGRAISTVGKILGPVGTTVAIVALAFSPFIAATLSAGLALGKLAFAMGAVVVRLGLIAFGGLITSLVTVIPMIRSFRDLWIALDLVMAANPIALTAIAIIAIGAAAVYAYNHFKGFHDAVVGTIEYLKRNASWLKYIAQFAMPGGPLVGLAIDNMPVPGRGAAVGTGVPGSPVVPAGGSLAHRGATARNFFQSQGWSKTAAAAITGNLMWEGNLNPRIVGDHGSAYGIAQWHAQRQAAFARVMHKSIIGSSLGEQLAFVNHELTQGAYKNVGAILRHAKSLNEATSIINRLYERPASPAASQNQRFALAQSVMSQPVIAQRGGGHGSTDGKVAVTVDINGAPRGSRVASRASGPNPPVLDTGLAWAN
jgi:hypothetical protein